MDIDNQDFYEYIDDIEEQHNNIRLPKRYLRDYDDPFQLYSNEEFKARYRFCKVTIRDIILPLMENALQKINNRGLPISPMIQVLLTLRYYATGNFQMVAGDLRGISQPSVSLIIKRVSEAIAVHLRNYVKFPNEHEENIRKFFQIAHFPSITSCVDGTHIPIKNPGGDVGEVFRNRKRIFSLNVQVACGPRIEILDIVARYPGSMHDNTIFQRSTLRIKYENNEIPGVVLGDNGYGCRQYLLTPVLNPVTRPERNYNAAHRRTRNIVERTFGVWKGRFLCLRKGITTKLETAVAIICATAVLHNIARARIDDDLEVDEEQYNNNIDIVLDDASANGLAFRRAFIITHFN